MKRALLAVLFLVPAFAYAALPPADGTGTPMSVKITCYAPGADLHMEGPFATSRAGALGGAWGRTSKPSTLDDFRLGRSTYVTLAANPTHYGKWFNMGAVTYVSNLDGRRYTISSVVGYVHDTGCAFMGSGERFGNVNSCCQRYGTCTDAFRKMDVAYGDFRASNANKGLVNSEAYCGNRNATWIQIGGPLTTPPTVSGGELVGLNPPPTSPAPSTFKQPPYSSAPPPPQYAQQPAPTQPTQYFGNSYASVPPNQPFPATFNTQSSSTTSGALTSGKSLGQSLLDLLKPITTGVQPVKPITIVTGTSSVGSITTPAPSTHITITSLNTNPAYSPPQTFVQTYLETQRPSATSDTAAFGRMLETLKGALQRILEILRLR